MSAKRPDSLVASVPPAWEPFLNAVDRHLTESVQLHCIGGFAMAAYGCLKRETRDLDFISVAPTTAARHLEECAGRQSSLAKRYKLYLEQVGVADYPDDYEKRVIFVEGGNLRHLRLLVLEPHDLVLAKLTRNNTKDIYDVRQMAQTGLLNPGTLRRRYVQCLRSYLPAPDKHDLTIDLWTEGINQVQVERRSPQLPAMADESVDAILERMEELRQLAKRPLADWEGQRAREELQTLEEQYRSAIKELADDNTRHRGGRAR